jgi:hypothetical protein
MTKTGGGKGTNQYAVKGVSQASRQSTAVLDDLAAEVVRESWSCDHGEWVHLTVVRRADGHLVEVRAEDAEATPPPARLRRLSRPVTWARAR